MKITKRLGKQTSNASISNEIGSVLCQRCVETKTKQTKKNITGMH